MRVHSGERELNSSNLNVVPHRKNCRPAAWARIPGKCGADGTEVKARKLDIELRKPLRIGESATVNTVLDGLSHGEIQPVEPFQTVLVYAQAVDSLHRI